MNAEEYRAAQAALIEQISAGVLTPTAVPMRKNYVDRAFCLSLLAFPPQSVAQRIDTEIIHVLQSQDDAHHFYPPASLHITIKNIFTASEARQFTANDVNAARDAISRAMERIPPLSFALKGPVVFPGSIVVRAYAPACYPNIVATISSELSRTGVPDNKRYASDNIFFGSITACRFTQAPSSRLLESVEQLANRDLGELTVREMDLVECDEVCSTQSRRVHQRYSILRQTDMLVRVTQDFS